MMAAFIRLRREPRQQGGVLIEMTVLLVVLLFVAGGMLQLGRVMWYYQAMHRATRDVARYLARVPITERNHPVEGPAMRLYGYALLTDALRGAGLPSAAAAQMQPRISCLPAPCTNSGTPAAVTVELKYVLNDTSLLPQYEEGDAGSYAWIPLEVRTTLPYIGR